MAPRSSSSKGDRAKRRTKTTGVRAVLKPTHAPPSSVEDLFSDNQLKGEFNTPAIYAWFQKRHSKGLNFLDDDGYYRRGDDEWKVPYGVRCALKQPLIWSQIANKYPFLVTWRSPKTGKRMFKRMMSLPHAIVFIATKAQYVDAHATVINRIGMDIPPAMRNKIPQPWKWCPRCMKPRKYKRLYHSSGDPQTFYGPLKVWVEDRNKRGELIGGHYETKDVKLALMACPVCGSTNRDPKFRRSNQPWEKVKIKRGSTRMKRRRKRK